MEKHFGEHLMIDGYGGNESKLNDRDLVLNCLNELPEKLGMKKLAAPQIYFAEANDLKDPGGWTGVVVIAESHISIHTFPKRGFVTADVYTCKSGMNNDLILDYFKSAFELRELEVNFVKRGLNYPETNTY
jgi:S-adenosylmethionine decarboxylase